MRMRSLRSPWLFAGIALVGWGGCGPKERGPKQSLDTGIAEVDALAGDCHTQSCGGNSPVVNQFPVNGLHSDGRGNAEGMWLIKGSFAPRRDWKQTKPPCTSGLTLRVRGNALVASDRPIDHGPRKLC